MSRLAQTVQCGDGVSSGTVGVPLLPELGPLVGLRAVGKYRADNFFTVYSLTVRGGLLESLRGEDGSEGWVGRLPFHTAAPYHRKLTARERGSSD